ncbi:MAG: hypothetical protein UX24_C0006G0008 [Candidatus Giovannonibacteria bacterium GW2011_GWB1_45_9b]|uniref:Uncharacterized protein n=6 Tax=Candidatus Giovannoniibacteriota TaxID=1752738 RepID=A0A1F5X0X4_9BACT|nr:MAG: hypothetical protein UW74_C0025G0008 [Candidatus Giovannonibacteria bacterium GW2011_GWC2_44_8]KKU16595.1 MAG: hypothetical protein UX24_C0006G0008 [Candidatus Giovannonibacteria bacterium GW2011_GWB1_45_9b]OGF73735.1 MAG: hypothetical protein A2W57_03910 [Candidatus Giovannonibacteria bacterium RIFCSPHIGHO2_02_43_16]OGF81510.1 MAG: hypothetical protein A2W48_01735 [Candidatus Giovannonibacteria bacterium RIFCSPHIGHO2_12_44_12]OGF84126.1 MAG: hypothetical protein A2Z63_02965 [Candidatus
MNNTLAVIKNMFYFFSSLEGLLILIPPIVVSYYFSSRLSIKWVQYTISLLGSLLLLIFIFLFYVLNTNPGMESLGVFFYFLIGLPYTIIISPLTVFLIDRHRNK